MRRLVVATFDGQRGCVDAHLDRRRPVGVHLPVFMVVALELELQVWPGRRTYVGVVWVITGGRTRTNPFSYPSAKALICLSVCIRMWVNAGEEVGRIDYKQFALALCPNMTPFRGPCLTFLPPPSVLIIAQTIYPNTYLDFAIKHNHILNYLTTKLKCQSMKAFCKK